MRKNANLDPEEYGCECGRQAVMFYHSAPVCARCRDLERRMDSFHDDLAEGKLGDRRKRVNRTQVGFFDPVLGAHRLTLALP